LLYSPTVIIATNGREPVWDADHAGWIREYQIPVHEDRIVQVEHEDHQIRAIRFDDGQLIAMDALFATRGDIYHNRLARSLGAAVDAEGEIVVDAHLQTSVPGLYAAGCVTPANCQMIIAAGQGAIAAQAINRDLFHESLANHELRRFRDEQLEKSQTVPEGAGKDA